MMDIKALQLAARFSLPPNSLGYCGKNTAPARLIECVISGECQKVADELEKFIVLNPYLATLAKITGKNKFSYLVIEAYWLGNDELKKARIKDYHLLLDNFSKQGVPEWLITELKETPPRKFVPNHLFQVLHVGVGRASGSVPYNIDTINNCMIRWGKVKRISKDKLTVSLNSLKGDAKNYQLTRIEETFPYNKKFLEGVKSGDNIAVHWKQVVKILNKDEVENLEYWTREVLDKLQVLGIGQ